MRDDSVVELINNINLVKNSVDLKDYAINTTICGQNRMLVDSLSLNNNEHELASIVEELEFSLGHFLLNDDSTVNQVLKNKLLNIGITITRLNSETYCLNFTDFSIAFNV